MYSIRGADYASLLKRSFSETFKVSQGSGGVPGRFACYTSGYRENDFDILHLRGSFEDDVCIDRLQDNTHVSLHFQLKGHSDAQISGFNDPLPMAKGELNLFNCVEPQSTFYFSRQQHYEYVCIGLSSAYFEQLLMGFGPAFGGLLNQALKKEPFKAFDKNLALAPELLSQLYLLMQPPVSADLRLPYLQAKINELLILILGAQQKPGHIITYSTDKEIFLAIRNYLQVNYLSPLSLHGIATHFNMNEFKLKQGFKATFGITVFAYIHQLRMHYAHQLSTDGRYTIGEIAALTGYNSDTSFIRAFKKEFGRSPGQLLR